MSILQSIFIALGGNYRASEYLPDTVPRGSVFDSEAGVAYFSLDKSQTVLKKVFSMRQYTSEELAMQQYHDRGGDTPDMPFRIRYGGKKSLNFVSGMKFFYFFDEAFPDKYALHYDPIHYRYDVYPGVVKSYSREATVTMEELGLASGEPQQHTINIPVYLTEGKVKGIVSFRRSKAIKDNVESYKIKIAELVARTFAEEFPAKAEDVDVRKNRHNQKGKGYSAETEPAEKKRWEFKLKSQTKKFAINFLKDVRDIWMQGIKVHSAETASHVRNVAEFAVMIAKEINDAKEEAYSDVKIEPEEMQLFCLGAELHDFGKLFTPIRILETGVPVPGDRFELSKRDAAVMERHAEDFYDFLDIPGNKYFEIVRNFSGAHHLFANGKAGYPRRLIDILDGQAPFEAKILAVADVYEALTAKRNYREHMGLAPSIALQIMIGMANRGQIDKHLLRFCVERDIFAKFSEGKSYVSTYDEELFEALSYKTEDVREVYAIKDSFAIRHLAELGITPEHALYKKKKQEIMDAFGVNNNRFNEMLDEYKRKQKNLVRASTNAPIKEEDKYPIDLEKIKAVRDEINKVCSDRGWDEAYIKKVMYVNERRMTEIEEFKKQMVAKLQAMNGLSGYDLKVSILEDAVASKLKDKTGFRRTKKNGDYGVQPGFAEAICEHTINLMESGDKENEPDVAIGEKVKYQAIKEKIKKDFSKEPIQPFERFTLFTHSRSRAEASVSA